ncbi:2' O-ribose methyltransferase [Varicellaria rhodocarpa]|nr:2' O-ribose methyltransferase [Varicellaria rhodocarpa]
MLYLWRSSVTSHIQSLRTIDLQSRLKLLALTYRNEGVSVPHRTLQRSSSSSSKRWQSRHGKDAFAKEARVQGLKSRAAFKLLEINHKYKIFEKGQTVVDLGYAPGSWSQVAQDRTQPYGRVVGIDIIPTQPPKGVSTIQGNFLSEAVQEEVKKYLRDPASGSLRQSSFLSTANDSKASREGEVDASETNYVELEARAERSPGVTSEQDNPIRHKSRGEIGEAEGRMVDVVLSDMSAPWEQTTGFWRKSLSNPYYRMMNTSGMNFRDHIGSMNLCNAALRFAFDTLRGGGHFICKFYQGSDDKMLEHRLKKLFTKVHREKPESSRSESKEAYFVALRRKPDTSDEDAFRNI